MNSNMHSHYYICTYNSMSGFKNPIFNTKYSVKKISLGILRWKLQVWPQIFKFVLTILCMNSEIRFWTHKTEFKSEILIFHWQFWVESFKVELEFPLFTSLMNATSLYLCTLVRLVSRSRLKIFINPLGNHCFVLQIFVFHLEHFSIFFYFKKFYTV